MFGLAVSQLKSRLSPYAQSYHNLAVVLALGLHDFLIWVCILGAMASMQVEDPESRHFFIDMMSTVERDLRWCEASTIEGQGFIKPDPCFVDTSDRTLQARTWMEIRDSCLLPYLWHHSACNTAGQEVWAEVLQRIHEGGRQAWK